MRIKTYFFINLLLLILLNLFNLPLAFANPTPLPANQVFRLTKQQIDGNAVKLRWKIAPGYFLYRDRIKLKAADPNKLTLGRVSLPRGKTKYDKFLGHYQVYYKTLTLTVPLLSQTSGKAQLGIYYQGCSDEGFCYPPSNKYLNLTFDKTHQIIQTHWINPKKTAQAFSATGLFQGQYGLFWTLIGFYILGLMLSFTPCVLPMIPVLSGIIVGGRGKTSPRRALSLSIIFVLSVAIVYAILGVITASMGANLQATLQKPWILSAFAGIFILLALSMFGFYDLQLPQSFQQKLSTLSAKQQGGSYIGAASMGMLSSILLSPCVTAPLVGILTYIAQTGDKALGASSLFILSLGMGTPLLFIGTSAGVLLPKAGHWMNAVKAFFGFLLLGVAIYLIGRIIPEAWVLILWGILTFGAGLYYGHMIYRTKSKFIWFFKTSVIILIIYGIIMIVGGLLNNHRPLAPLENLYTQPSEKLKFIRVKSLANVIDQLERARIKNKPVLLDFYADWCTACKTIEHDVFGNREVKQALKNTVLLQADVTKNDRIDQALLNYFNVIAPPTMILFDKTGQARTDGRIIGEITASQFLSKFKLIH